MPHALMLSGSRVTGFDRSRPQPIAAPWIEVTAAQYDAALGMAYPRWTGAGVVNEPPPPPTLAEVKAARIAAIAAESAARFESRWPADERVASLGGVLLTPAAPDAVSDAEAHIVARNAAVAAVNAATDAAGVAAVTVGWPT